MLAGVSITRLNNRSRMLATLDFVLNFVLVNDAKIQVYRNLCQLIALNCR